MFTASETGPEIQDTKVRFRIHLPSIKKDLGFAVKVYVINKQGQFDINVPADVYELNPFTLNPSGDDLWGEIAKSRWQTDLIPLSPGTYLYRFEITGPARDGGGQVRSLYFGDPCARETDAGIFSVFNIPARTPHVWGDGNFKVPPLEDIILYELNVAEFGGDFKGVAERIPYLLSLGVNAIELLPVNSIAEPNRWGYMPVFYLHRKSASAARRGCAISSNNATPPISPWSSIWSTPIQIEFFLTRSAMNVFSTFGKMTNIQTGAAPGSLRTH